MPAIENWVRTCEEHQRSAPRKPVQAVGRIAAEQPMQWAQLGWILGLPNTESGNTCTVIAIDGFAGYVMARAHPAATSENSARSLADEVAFEYGLPQCVQTDYGTHFLGHFQ